jgi:hypothetical protein
MRQEFLRIVLVLFGLQAAFLSGAQLHGQQAGTNSSNPQDSVASLVQVACNTNLPFAFRQFKKGQIERLRDEDQMTIDLLNKDATTTQGFTRDRPKGRLSRLSSPGCECKLRPRRLFSPMAAGPTRQQLQLLLLRLLPLRLLLPLHLCLSS